MSREKPLARPKISAIVTTLDEERNIADCLEALLWCDEIMVVDSYSTDDTVEIIRGIAERHDHFELAQRTYYGAASQKNWAIDRVGGEWLLFFDADERCTPELRREIEELLAGEPEHDAYKIHRRVYFLGQRLRYSGWQHDMVVRLVRRGTARYPDRRVHSDMEIRNEVPRLEHSMEHFMVDDLYAYLLKTVKYGHWGAAQAWREGKKAGFLEIFGRSTWRFFRTYGVQAGVLDGLRGLVFCMLQAFGTYVKWAVLWGWGVNAARGLEPDLPIFEDDDETDAGQRDVLSSRR